MMHRAESEPSTSVSLSRDDALALYRRMQTIRRMETAAGNLYKEKAIRGFCHLYSGQVPDAGGTARDSCSGVTLWGTRGRDVPVDLTRVRYERGSCELAP